MCSTSATSSASVSGTWKYSQIFSQPRSRMSRRIRRNTACRRHSDHDELLQIRRLGPLLRARQPVRDEIDDGLLIDVAQRRAFAIAHRMSRRAPNSCALKPPPPTSYARCWYRRRLPRPARIAAPPLRACLSSSNNSANSSERACRPRDSSRSAADGSCSCTGRRIRSRSPRCT